MCSSSPSRTPKLQLPAAQASRGGRWNPPKKIPTSKGKGEVTVREYRECNQVKIKPHTQWTGGSQTGKQWCQTGSRTFAKVPGPTSVFQLGIPRESDFKDRGLWLYNFLMTERSRDSWRLQTKTCAHQDPGERSSDPTREPACECFRVSCGGINQQWPAMGTVHFSSVAQSGPTLCDLMNCSTPDLPVYQQLQESTQTHVYWVGDAIQSSHPLSSPSPPALNLSHHQGLFKWVSSSHQVAKVLEFQLQH